MARKNKLEIAAEGMFIEQGLNAKEIAETLEIREGTVSTWRKKGNWDELRDENIASPHQIRRILLQEMKKVSKGEKTLIDADALSKIGKVMESLSNRISPQVVISVLKALDNFTARENPQLAVDSLPLHRKFIQHCIDSNGF